MKILYLSNVPSPYIVDFLNELGKYCGVTAIFERSDSSERDKSWKKYHFIHFTGILLHGLKYHTDSAISIGVLSYIQKGNYDFIIVANPCTPTGILALEYMKFRKIPYIIESEGGFAKDGVGIKEHFKKQILSGASLYFSTCQTDDDYFLMYGAKKDRIVRFPFTTLHQEDIPEKMLTREEKKLIKEKLNFKHPYMILSIGRMIPIKGFGTLLRACTNLPKEAGVCIIGGQPPKEFVTLIHKRKLKNIYFYDFMNKNTIRDYYLASDLFVLPTKLDTWGLVIVEAMSYGLPVISTNGCVAALALIQDNENGFLIPAKNPKVLNQKLQYMIQNPDVSKQMGVNNLSKMQNYTIEEMARRHIQVFSDMKK